MLFRSAAPFPPPTHTNFYHLPLAAVRRYESKEGRVVFALHGVGEDKTCLKYRIIEESEVAGRKPSIVKVHDFYRPEERNIKVGVRAASGLCDE